MPLRLVFYTFCLGDRNKHYNNGFTIIIIIVIIFNVIVFNINYFEPLI